MRRIPNWLWRGCVVTLLGTVIGIGILVGMTGAGIADPHPIGSLVVNDDLASETDWVLWPEAAQTWFSGGELVVLAPDPRMQAFLTAPYTFAAPSTLDVLAWQSDSSPGEAGYGLWWGEGPQGIHVIVAVNGNGYLGIFLNDGQAVHPVMKWQRFPHVHPRGDTNLLRVDLIEGRATVRVNDEIATTFTWVDTGPLHMGFYLETFNRGRASIHFDRLRIWQPVSN